MLKLVKQLGNKLADNYNITTIVRAINLIGKRKYFLVSAIIVFCAVELCCNALYTVGIKGVLNAVTGKNTGLFWKSMMFILSNHLLWWTYAPFSCYVCAKASKVTVSNFKTQMCEHIVRLPMRYLDRKPTGELLSALSNDVGCLSKVYDWTFFQVLRSATGGAGGIIIMAVLDWRFAIVVVLLGMVSILVSSRFSKKLEVVGKEQQEQLSKSCTDAYELVRAARTIRLMRLQENKEANYKKITGLEADTRKKSGQISARMNSTINGIGLVANAVILFTGALFVLYGFSDWGSVIALLGLKYTTDMLFVECGQFMAEMQTNIAGIKRLFSIMDEAEETVDCKSYLVQNMQESISMMDVTFSYDDKTSILSGFHLSLQKNGLTALTGESGSGKSTVMKLVLGLYTPDKGQIIFNNNNMSSKHIRQFTAYVPQDPGLFRGTIYENIAFGNPEASEEVILSAAKLAGADEFIRSFEKGYDSLLLDDGKSLSGGQRQRIAIARALVKDAPILLLDEITSALDKETEEHILQTVKHIAKNKAILFITHRQDVQKWADKVICMD